MSRSVVFNESVMFTDSLSTDDALVEKLQPHVSVQVELMDDQEIEVIGNDVPDNVSNTVQHSPPVSQPVLQQEEDLDVPITLRRSKRSCGPPSRLIEECNMIHYALSCVEQVEDGSEPATYIEAIDYVDREKWISAMQEEMQSLEKNGTWEIVRLPKQKKSIRCKWVFKRKESLSPSEPPKFKARLVAKDFSQIPCVDYNDVFSPVVKHSSIQIFFSIITMHNLELEQLDVKTAFLHIELEEQIYMD
jgi:hypothetical protein